MTEDAEADGEEPELATARLAREIRRLRKAANLSQPRLAGMIGYSRQYVSLAERPGKGLASAELVRAIDRVLEADGALLALREKAKTERQALRGGSSAATATDVTTPQLDRVLVPVQIDGRVVLLPTETSDSIGEFTSEVVAPGSTTRAWATTAAEWSAMSPFDRRLFQRESLAATAPPDLDLDEVHHVARALNEAHRYLDGSVVSYFRRQLGTCATEDGKRGPAKALPTVLGILCAIEHSARNVRPTQRRELLSVGARAAELAGWLFRDARDPIRASYWRDRATEWAQEAGEYAMQGYILLKKAQAAYDERDALRMLTLAQAAQNGPWNLPARVRAEVAQQEARGHAMLGDDLDQVTRKLDQAHRLLAAIDDEVTDDSELGVHYNQTVLAMQTAICHTEAGQPRQAVELYQEWLRDNQFSPRDYGYFLSLMASALALAGDPDHAATTGLTSLSLAIETNSARTMQELSNVLSVMQPWRNRAGVRELREAVLAK